MKHVVACCRGDMLLDLPKQQKCGNCKQYIENCECDVLKKHAEDNPDEYHGFNKEGRKAPQLDEVNRKRKGLLSFVIDHFEGIYRKYTHEAYIFHCIRVAKLADLYLDHDYAFEIGLCHDLIEDTECTYDELRGALDSFGYKYIEKIVQPVRELTNEFTKSKYPRLSREERKRREASRLGKCMDISQSIKYCDIIDNIEGIVSLDRKFAKVYLSEKAKVLTEARGGDLDLMVKCYTAIKKELKELEFHSL